MFVAEEMNWFDAVDYCHQYNTHLLRIETEEELEVVRKLDSVQALYTDPSNVVKILEERILSPGIFNLYDYIFSDLIARICLLKVLFIAFGLYL